MYGILSQIEAQLFLKNAWFLPIFFWIPRVLTKIYFLRIVLNKNILVIVSIGDRKSEYLEMRRTYAQQQ